MEPLAAAALLLTLHLGAAQTLQTPCGPVTVALLPYSPLPGPPTGYYLALRPAGLRAAIAAEPPGAPVPLARRGGWLVTATPLPLTARARLRVTCPGGVFEAVVAAAPEPRGESGEAPLSPPEPRWRDPFNLSAIYRRTVLGEEPRHQPPGGAAAAETGEEQRNGAGGGRGGSGWWGGATPWRLLGAAVLLAALLERLSSSRGPRRSGGGA